MNGIILSIKQLVSLVRPKRQALDNAILWNNYPEILNGWLGPTRNDQNAGKRPVAHRRIYGIVETSTQRTYDVGKETAHRPTKRRRKTLNFKIPIAT